VKDYQHWLNSFMESWKNLEGEKTVDLMAENCIYYEYPTDAPATSKEQIKKWWAVVPHNQKDISYSGKILFENDENCFYHFTLNRTRLNKKDKSWGKQIIDGIFEIKLNNDNLLTYFKWWHHTKETL